MDTYINGGDFAADDYGQPKSIYGAKEAAQRAAFIFSTRKGNFIYDRDLGMNIDLLGFPVSRLNGERLLVFCRAALAGRCDFTVESASFQYVGGVGRLYFTVKCGDETSNGIALIRFDQGENSNAIL